MRWGIPTRLYHWHAVVTVFTAALIFGTQAGLGSFIMVNPAINSSALLVGIPEYMMLGLLLTELLLSLAIAWKKADANTLLSVTLLGLIWVSLAAIVAPDGHIVRSILPGLLPNQVFLMTWVVTIAWAARGFLALLVASMGDDGKRTSSSRLSFAQA